MPKQSLTGQQGTTTTAPVVNDVEQEEVVKEEKSVIKHTLPELMGRFVQKCLEDPRQTTQCGHELQMWYDANMPLDETRKEKLQENRKVVERAKQVTEYLFQQFQLIAQKDM